MRIPKTLTSSAQKARYFSASCPDGSQDSSSRTSISTRQFRKVGSLVHLAAWSTQGWILTMPTGLFHKKLVKEALYRHHVPSKFSKLILDYYNNFQLRVTPGPLTSEWHRLERGIINGCTISVTLFALAMNMVVKSAEVECRGSLTKTGVRLPPIRVYMDDLTLSVLAHPHPSLIHPFL